MSIELERTYRFSAAHQYYRPEWTEAENLRRFGKCSFAPGHGHNYRLTLHLAGPIDPATGFLVDLGLLDDIVRGAVLEPLDHRHLNQAVDEFARGESIPTSESLAQWIATQLRDRLPSGVRLTRLRVAEDDDLAAIWRAGEA